MSFITRAELADQVSNKSGIISIQEASRKAFGTVGATVFLSHSHADHELIEFARLRGNWVMLTVKKYGTTRRLSATG